MKNALLIFFVLLATLNVICYLVYGDFYHVVSFALCFVGIVFQKRKVMAK